MLTSLLTIIVYIAIIGLVVWAITTFIPMPAPFQKLIYVICGIVCLLILLSMLSGGGISLPSLK